MTLNEFKTQILTEQELKQFSEKEIEQLFGMSSRFADIAFKMFIDKKLKDLDNK
jgi:hypothetical protein